jgi:hypothetical protein
LTFQTLQNTFSDSPWSTPVHHVKSILIDSITNLNLVLANTATAPLHTRQTTCPTSSALVRCCVPCLPHASPLSPRRASAILAKISWVAYPHHLRPHYRSISRTPTDAEFHASLRPCAPVRANVLLAFPLTRLRLSACLRRSPSISRVKSSVRLQLRLQHDSLVEDQSTPCPVDFKVSCVAILNQPRAIACRSTHPLGMRHVFSCPQNSDSISPHAPTSLSPIFTVFCLRQTI